MRLIAIVGLALLLAGCSSRPALEFGFGSPPTVAQTRGIVQEHLEVALKDPTNIQGLTIGRPEAACYSRGPGKRDVCGYRVCVAYNAKNSFGGYVGRKVYVYWILKRWGLQIAENRGACPMTFDDWFGSPPVETKDFCAFQPRNAGCLNGKVEQFAPVAEEMPAAPVPAHAPSGSAYDECMRRVLRISDQSLRLQAMGSCDGAK